MKNVLKGICIALLFCMQSFAQSAPSNVGCMLNEGGLRMYYGSNFKETKSNGTYRYVYTGTYYPERVGTTCPPGRKYFTFGAFYTENGVRIGCHRSTDFNSPLGEMRYFSVFDCPLDDNVWILCAVVGLVAYLGRKRLFIM